MNKVDFSTLVSFVNQKIGKLSNLAIFLFEGIGSFLALAEACSKRAFFKCKIELITELIALAI